jgi:hypothetical protein
MNVIKKKTLDGFAARHADAADPLSSYMRIIAFITEASSVRKILDHPGEATLPPKRL